VELRLISYYFISQLLKPAILTNPLNPSCNANANSPQAAKFQNSIFCPSKCRPLQCRELSLFLHPPPFPPPLSLAPPATLIRHCPFALPLAPPPLVNFYIRHCSCRQSGTAVCPGVDTTLEQPTSADTLRLELRSAGRRSDWYHSTAVFSGRRHRQHGQPYDVHVRAYVTAYHLTHWRN